MTCADLIALKTSTGDYAKAIAEYVGATVLYWDVPTVCVLHISNPTLSHLKMLLFIVRTPQNAVGHFSSPSPGSPH